MARLKTLDFEGAANGATATTGTTGFDSISSGITHISSPALVNTRSLQFTVGGTAASQFGRVDLGTPRALLHITTYERYSANPTNPFYPVSTNTGGSARANRRINANGTVTLRNGVNAVWTSTSTIPLGSSIRFEHKIDATNSVQSLTVYAGNGTSPLFMSGNQTYSQGTVDTILFGNTSAVANISFVGDWLAVNDDVPTGPAVPFTPSSVANAGPDKIDVEPYTTVTLRGTGSDGSITAEGWTQISGSPTVTLTGASTATATFTAPGTIAGVTLGFRYSITDGTTNTDDMAVTVLPVTERAAVGGVLVPVEIRVPDPAAAPTYRPLGYIGDGLTWQSGSDAPRLSLLAAGWPPQVLDVDGLTDRTMALGGVTHPNAGEVIDAWRAQDFDPYTWVIALGSHNLGATDAEWTTMAGEVLDKIAEGPRAGYVVNWVGISTRDATDTRPVRFMNVLNALVGTRPKITLRPVDWNAYVHDGRDETGLWDLADSVGRYMTAAGYDLRNTYIAAQVGSPT